MATTLTAVQAQGYQKEKLHSLARPAKKDGINPEGLTRTQVIKASPRKAPPTETPGVIELEPRVLLEALGIMPYRKEEPRMAPSTCSRGSGLDLFTF